MTSLLNDIVYVDTCLAFSPMPCEREVLEYITKEFGAIIVLVKEDDLCYNLRYWEDMGVDILHIPVKNHRSPTFIQLYWIMEWIDNKIDKGRRILVHCSDGLGRSGTIAASYLIYMYDLDWKDALNRVRNLRSGAVESIEQESMLRVLSLALKTLEKIDIRAIILVGEKHGWGWSEEHASKVMQLSLRLWEDLYKHLGLSEDSVKYLAIASLLHDIGKGREIEGENHAEASARLLKKTKILPPFALRQLDYLACIIKYHRKEGNPLEDPGCIRDKQLALLTALLKIGDGLDYMLNQAVADVKATINKDEIEIKAYCIDGCRGNIKRAEEKSWLLQQLVGKKVLVTLTEIKNRSNIQNR